MSSHEIGGLKSTLSNPNTSEEAKLNAREKLNDMGESATEGDKDPKRVMAGKKAAAHNEMNTGLGQKEASEEAGSGVDKNSYVEGDPTGEYKPE